MDEALSLVMVAPHPDDESIACGGVLALAAAEGIATAVVTCTGGEEGENLAGIDLGDEDLPTHRRRELADALVTVHAQGLFHEQITPENVIITTSGAVRLVGFGIEASLDADRMSGSGGHRTTSFAGAHTLSYEHSCGLVLPWSTVARVGRAPSEAGLPARLPAAR